MKFFHRTDDTAMLMVIVDTDETLTKLNVPIVDMSALDTRIADLADILWDHNAFGAEGLGGHEKAIARERAYFVKSVRKHALSNTAGSLELTYREWDMRLIVSSFREVSDSTLAINVEVEAKAYPRENFDVDYEMLNSKLKHS